tara:strand:- start:940 stop:1974 length:1035 start_codon:yes stop_codon:yes gene_type:complete
MSFLRYPDNCFPASDEVLVDFSQKIKAAKLSSKEINDLPDSDFAYISPGGSKDSEGKTTPRSLRHLPIPDAAHVRNALARLNQTHIPAAAKKTALAKIKRKAKELGVEVSTSDATTNKSQQEKLEKEEYRQDASEKQKTAKEKFLDMINKKKGGDKKDSDKKNSDKKSDDKNPSEKEKAKGGMKDGKSSYPDPDELSAVATKVLKTKIVQKTRKEWDKIDKKELKRDSKKEKEEHEKDAIKDDESKIKKLKKGAPSEKKSVEIHDIKKDEKFDKKSKKADASHWPEVAFKPAPFDGKVDNPNRILEPTTWDKLKEELSLNNLWFKKPKAPKVDYRKFLDPHFTK